MAVYLSIIFGGVIVISLCNILFGAAALGLSWLEVFFIVFSAAVLDFIIDAIVAFVIHKLPKKWFNPYNRFFRVFGFERGFYERIGIKKWKDKIPEMGQLCNFKKDKIASVNDNGYLFKFLEETCYAEVLHFLSAVLGFLVILIFPSRLASAYTLPVAAVNCFLQILPIFIQRYTRPKLIKIFEHNQKINSAV